MQKIFRFWDMSDNRKNDVRVGFIDLQFMKVKILRNRKKRPRHQLTLACNSFPCYAAGLWNWHVWMKEDAEFYSVKKAIKQFI